MGCSFFSKKKLVEELKISKGKLAVEKTNRKVLAHRNETTRKGRRTHRNLNLSLLRETTTTEGRSRDAGWSHDSGR
jgi:hypothetical protein